MNESQEINITTVLKVQETVHEIIRKSSIIRTQIMRSQDIIQRKSHVRKVINILTVIKKTTKTTRLFQ